MLVTAHKYTTGQTHTVWMVRTCVLMESEIIPSQILANNRFRSMDEAKDTCTQARGAHLDFRQPRLKSNILSRAHAASHRTEPIQIRFPSWTTLPTSERYIHIHTYAVVVAVCANVSPLKGRARNKSRLAHSKGQSQTKPYPQISELVMFTCGKHAEQVEKTTRTDIMLSMDARKTFT